MHWTMTYLTSLTSSLLPVRTTGKGGFCESLPWVEANTQDIGFVDDLLLASIPLPDDKTRGGENEEGEKQADVNNATM